MKKQKKLIWKWSASIVWQDEYYATLEGMNYKVVPDKYDSRFERLELELSYGSIEYAIKYLRNLGLQVWSMQKLESPLSDEFGRLKPEYKILKENNIEEFEELFKGNL